MSWIKNVSALSKNVSSNVLASSKNVLASSTNVSSTCTIPDCGFQQKDRILCINLLGMGAFRSVYKGISEDDGTVFAVKVLDLSHHAASRSFLAECEILKNIRHRNVVKVLSACSSIDYEGNEFKAIVYEYMDKGSLEEWLHFTPDQESHEHKKLGFLQRLKTLPLMLPVLWIIFIMIANPQ
ncbi:lrr receptor-like serinethreonine-protein kinase efr [Nicotiana attenuata]|uniref:Lrr receptor-like serinethreonine-protein kinase efr n=2 Tax=Nicotiana attenuata TaxID=49451 RepID=A0A314LF04_NICAT|nr:lrr receptor-like serinethreonine-protein kinase efr [Nicotiana attenuata]